MTRSDKDGMHKTLITQIDPKWRMTPRYDVGAVDTLEGLDFAILNCLKEPTDKKKSKAFFAQQQFNHSIQRLIEDGGVLRRNDNYSVEDYGCWDCCLCMVAHDLNARFYRYGKGRSLAPTPPNLIEALRSWQVLSLIGYSFDLVTDPMSLVTHNKVQLFMHEDYGIKGISPTKSALLTYALRHKEAVCIVASVEGHASYGNKDSTHWVVIDVANDSQTLMMRDPSKKKPSKFTYRKLYTLCLYATPKSIQSLLRVDH